MIQSSITAQLQALASEGLRRKRQVASSHALHFSCNDYLSLGCDSRVRKAYQRGFMQYPCGSGSSPALSGYHDIHRQLEQAMAQMLGVEDALLFNSGFAANLGLMQVLKQLQLEVIVDKSVHASVYDGLKLAQIHPMRYPNHNLEQLATCLRKQTRPLAVLTEGLFSMSGHTPDLAAIAQLCSVQQAVCLVDEAHSFGIMGKQGLGAVYHAGLSAQQVPLRVIAMGKAMAGQGAVIAGQADWIAMLIQSARTYTYSTAMSPALAYGLLETLDILRQADAAREALQQVVAYFKKARAMSPLVWRMSDSPIQQLQIGSAHEALRLAEGLARQDIVCFPVRPPTVSKKETGLRVVLNSNHTPEDIDRLFKALHERVP